MLDKVTLLLVIIGAVNIGLVTVLGFDFISIFGPLSPVVKLVVGFSGVYMLLTTYTTLLKTPA